MGLWLRALFTGRGGQLFGALAGLSLTVALLGSLGLFAVASSSTMARRAISGVPVDWQVQLAPGAESATVTKALEAAASPAVLQEVGYADVAGFVATTGGTTQTTGPGKALGIDPDYPRRLPGQMRLLQGSWDGPLVYAQTAANLHVAPGDRVTVERIGAPPAVLNIAGVVTLPNADAMFQAVGVPPGLAPQAPPDNVLILPRGQWQALFEPQRTARPDTVRQQLHVRLARDRLPADPNDAFIELVRTANNFEARVAGSAAVANNLAARLDAVRADALYARVLFVFLGVPGVVLSLLLTLAVARAGARRRQREQALLRLRGASLAQLLGLAWLEAGVMGVLGSIAGMLLAAGAALAWWPLADLARAWPWLVVAALLGFLAAIAAFLVPAWRQATRETVAASRSEIRRGAPSLWQRAWLDLLLLALGGLLAWAYARTGYELVLAPEGVPQTSIHYEAFLGPLALWSGAGLLWLRLTRLLLVRGRGWVAAAVAPFVRDLAPLIAASLSRQGERIAQGVALVALAFAFAVSTAIFNTTYDAQARVDAELTNGADVTVTGTTAQPAAALLAQLRALPGVAAAQPMMHRYAYVGADLQDLYGIDPARLGEATPLANAYFGNRDAAKTLSALAQTPDGVLVSEETVTDFQLQPGDQLNLRLQSAVDHQYHVEHFRFVGVAREFPTAPKDSFLVANAAYVAQQTGSDAREVVLMRAPGDATGVAAATRDIAAKFPVLRVTTLSEAQRIIGSSLTAVDLRGLTRLELGFAVLMIAGVAGLILGLGLEERRRSYTLLSALGARPGQIGGFLWSEGLIVVVGGAVLGIAAGFGIARTLVAILSGVFDPPPEALAVPWAYLAATLVAALASGAFAVGLVHRLSIRADLEMLRGE